MTLSFCRACGEPLQPDMPACPNCGRDRVAANGARRARTADPGSRLVGAVGVFMSGALLVWFAYALTTESLITDGPCDEGAGLLVAGLFTQIFGIGLAARALVTGRVPVWAWPLSFALGIAAAISAGTISVSDCITV
jgi:hypothetical protein